MVASTFGGAFDKLDHQLQRTIISNLNQRRKNYCAALTGKRWPEMKVILVGDRPGPGAKKLPTNHHHTPFYSTKNSSLWLNKQLAELGVDENTLLWLNAADMNGVPSHPCHIEGWGNPSIIALGGNAAKWLDQWPGKRYTKVHHPQAWKRFHAHEPYPLLGYLQLALDL
jgi:hypothetical protein